MNNYIKIGFKPCPKCGSENISIEKLMEGY